MNNIKHTYHYYHTPTTHQTMKNEFEVLPSPIKGHLDWREFRALRLANGMTVVLVHDAFSRTFGAAARVNAGAAADPRQYPGLAHFCEHMCFRGSEEFPVENDYKAYLAQHGGRSNASTSLYATTFYFEVVGDKAAQGALDRFYNFFVAPLFTESCTDREVNAVDSENSKNLTNDSRRRLQILKELCDQEHYVSKFTTGNNLTLPTSSEEELSQLREALLAFHAYHYNPDNMTVVMAGPQDLDTLQEWAVSRWSAVESRSFEAFSPEVKQLITTAAYEAPNMTQGGSEEEPDFNSPLLSAAQLLETDHRGPLVAVVKPVRPLRQLVLFWALPSVQHIPDNSPLSLLGHLLGHEGPKSIFAHLQNEGLLTSLSAGPRLSAPDFSIFQVSIQLTPSGEKKWSYVVKIVLEYLQVLVTSLDAAVDGSAEALQEWRRVWNEKVQLANLHFEYRLTPGSVYTYTSSLAHAVFHYGTLDCLKAGAMLGQKEDGSEDDLSRGEGLPLERMHECVHKLLRPENMVIERCSHSAWEEAEQIEAARQAETESPPLPLMEKRQEQWYGVDFFLGTLSPDDEHLASLLDTKELAGLKPADSSLKLPRPNRYIPRTLKLCPDLPESIRNERTPRIDNEMAPPSLLLDDDRRGRLWYRLDDRYSQPKAHFTIHMTNAAVQNVPSENGGWEYSVDAYIKSTILSSMFRQAQAQDTYDADLAGLYWSTSLNSSGVHFAYSGFHDRLPDLSMDVLRAFVDNSDDSWVKKERFFKSAKDSLLRNLRNFFASRRADAHATYYRDLLLEDQQVSVDDSIKAAETVSLKDVIAHHTVLIQNESVSLDCLSIGNLSKEQAVALFIEATDFLTEARQGKALMDPDLWTPGSSEARLSPGEDIELHFASENPEEENGAVIVTFQSPIPGYVGPALSTPESLESSACLRLLSHILREPIFNELRTKQTLGYVVNSYFESGSSLRPAKLQHLGPLNVPVDALSIVVLSRKVSPPEAAERIDAFLEEFRTTLANLPESEILSHARSLSTKLLKPIQNLATEASTQFSKIKNYAPQILADGGSPDDIPWNPVAARQLAARLRNLNRSHLLKTWDSMCLPGSRARIVSCVYGSTFSFEEHFRKACPGAAVVTKVPDILAMRKKMPPYDDQPTPKRRWWSPIKQSGSPLAALTLLGIGALGWTIWNRSTRKTAK